MMEMANFKKHLKTEAFCYNWKKKKLMEVM